MKKVPTRSNAALAHQEERSSRKAEVTGSSPVSGSIEA